MTAANSQVQVVNLEFLKDLCREILKLLLKGVEERFFVHIVTFSHTYINIGHSLLCSFTINQLIICFFLLYPEICFQICLVYSHV